MYNFLIVLIVIASILLVFLVLIQNSKGGGLAAGFGSGNQVMGVRRTTDFLEKATWTLVALIGLFSIFATGIRKGELSTNNEGSAVTHHAQEQNEQEGAVLPDFEEAETPEAEIPAEEGAAEE